MYQIDTADLARAILADRKGSKGGVERVLSRHYLP